MYDWMYCCKVMQAGVRIFATRRSDFQGARQTGVTW
jgi:hypothetical protein